MRKTVFVGAALFAVCLACSSGTRRPSSPPPPPPEDNSLRDVLLRLGRGPCSLRPDASNSKWVIEFKTGGYQKTFEVDRVGTDFVRLTQGDLRYDLPFSSIVLVLSDN